MEQIVAALIACATIVPLIMNLKLLLSDSIRDANSLGILILVTIVLGGLLFEAKFLPRGQVVQMGFFAVIALLVILGTVRTFRNENGHRATLTLAMFLPALISAVMFLSNAIFNPGLPIDQSLGRLLAVAILLLISLGTAISHVQITALCRVILVSVLGVLLVSPLTSDNWRTCDIFKCGPFGAIYTGPFASENALAIFSCVALLCVFATWSGPRSLWSVAPLALTLYASESRTSQLALGCAIATWALLLLWSKAFGTAENFPKQRFVLSALTAIIGVVSFYLLFTAEPSSFSNRGNIWIRGLSALGDQWLSGLGLDRWTYLQSAGILPLLFPHNQNLLLLFGGGALAVILFYVLLIGSVRASSRDAGTVGFGASYVIFISVLGITEAYWNPIAFDGHTFLILPLIFLVAGRTCAKREIVPLKRQPRLVASSRAAKGLVYGHKRHHSDFEVDGWVKSTR